MTDEPRTIVTFRSSGFNTTESRPNYINDNNYGDDVTEWLRVQLKQAGVAVGPKIGQEDFGWYLGFRLGKHDYEFIIGYNADGYWMGFIERSRGFLGSLLGLRYQGLGANAASTIHSLLLSSKIIHDIRWHYRKDFDARREELGSASPV